MKRTFGFIFSILLAVYLAVAPAAALTIEVSDNGSGSTNEVSTSVAQDTSVTQTNESQVANDVDTSANTGGNEASSNTGEEVAITTGDVSQTTSVTNDLNTSVASVQCCPSDTSVTISGNGTDSQNNVNLELSYTTTATSTNVATVLNHISGNANTGYNTASDNNGNVSIDTGNINISAWINNSVNHASLVLPGGGSGISARISGNGSGSNNNIALSQLNLWNAFVANIANITNNLAWDANTGGNNASGNNGNVSITTGDILIRLGIKNKANTSKVEITCCPQDPDDPGVPTPNPSPSTPPVGGSGPPDTKDNGSDNDGGGSSGSVLGAILPATGSNLLLWLTFANLALLTLGIYLKTPRRQVKLVFSIA